MALGILLALAELVSWWGVLVLPATVALMVKLNDVIAGALTQQAAPPPRLPVHPSKARPHVLRPATTTGPAPARCVGEEATSRLPRVIDGDRGTPVQRPWAEHLEAQRQRVRQSATRRYE